MGRKFLINQTGDCGFYGTDFWWDTWAHVVGIPILWFGDAFVDHFAATREWEWRQWQNAVHEGDVLEYVWDHTQARADMMMTR